MAEEKMNSSVEETVEVSAKENKKEKPVNKKPNFFVRIFKRIKKFFKDVAGEMKKVVWTSKEDLKKSTKLVLVTVVAIGLAIAVVDTVCSLFINSLAGLIG